MSPNQTTLINRYRRQGIMIDTNLLLMLVIGDTDESVIRTFKRTQRFSPDDYHVLQNVITRFDQQITTSHILTEVSNLAGQLTGDLRQAVYISFQTQINTMNEVSVDAKHIVDTSMFSQFGITDTAIYLASKDRFLVITTDSPLYGYLIGNGVDAINFNHLLTP